MLLAPPTGGVGSVPVRYEFARRTLSKIRLAIKGAGVWLRRASDAGSEISSEPPRDASVRARRQHGRCTTQPRPDVGCRRRWGRSMAEVSYLGAGDHACELLSSDVG